MTADMQLAELAGEWSGPSQLWIHPDDPMHESHSTAQIGQLARGQFVTIDYTWAFEGEPQEGLIVFGLGPDAHSASAVWFDSWHMANQVMVMRPEYLADKVALHGSYAAPSGPDWGWRIELESSDQTSWTLRMFNILPDGRAFPAVLTVYERAG